MIVCISLPLLACAQDKTAPAPPAAPAAAPAAKAEATPKAAPAGKTIDHGPLDAVLRANVKGDKFNYQGVVGNESFKAYVKLIGETDPNSLPTREAKLAFYINAYNALTINSVLGYWPKITSVSTIKPDFGFFKDKTQRVGGKMLSLNQIENEIIRPTFKDARIHAALNCASVSCPPLANFAFTAGKLEKQLNDVFAGFANDAARNQVDTATGTVRISKILDWYKVDFKAAGGGAKYLSGFVKDPARKAALAAPKKVEFLPYDWNLNKP